MVLGFALRVVTRRFGWRQVVLWCSYVMPWWAVLDMVGVSVAGSFPAVSFLGRFYGIVFCLLRWLCLIVGGFGFGLAVCFLGLPIVLVFLVAVLLCCLIVSLDCVYGWFQYL